MATKPEAYIPQQVSIGPYHQHQLELYEMERYKLYAARRVQKQVPNLSFEGFIERFVKLNRMFRASYHRYLDSSDEALAWLMFLDGSFLLEYLQAFAKDLARVPTGKISHVIDQTGKKSTHNAVLRDIVMLENQIPLFVLKELIELVYNERSDEVFAAMLLGFCRKLSPFHNAGDLTLGDEELLGREHLLELLYNVSVPKPSATEPPLIEEFLIPSVTKLSKAGVKLFATVGDLSSIAFDHDSATLYLPRITLNENSEVILRNLVAFEATTTSKAFVLTRYIELMNGIVESEEDVKLLRERGIIHNQLKSDREVVDLWKGMSKTVKLTRAARIDEVIEGVNGYYEKSWKVQTGRFMSRYVFSSWPFLTFLGANLLLLLTSLQAFCSIYGCSRLRATVASTLPPT
ncbi:putative UPF0481 protein [Acorus gramineus]|uniref:UPF0481 protein n=1 Tax=Acorus gramineus TaxID=55184 RepID=A0AAV9B7W4_ACOGR|nr:putative UPF0481 protein [Acorus gramineus]